VTIGLMHFLLLGVILLGAGVATLALKRNALGILMGVELILNAALINLVAFDRFGPQAGAMPGQMMAIFVIVIAAAEAAAALAIFLNFYHASATIDVDRGDTLKG
jgi:NADH:ubiquinone oxidoreductase subunit K